MMKQSQKSSYLSNSLRNKGFIAIATALLTACGGGSGDSSNSASNGPLFEIPSDTISKLGTISLGSVSGEAAELAGVSTGIAFGYAEFEDFGQVLPQEYLDLGFSSEQRCEIYIDSTDDSKDVGVDAPPEIEAINAGSQTVSAGDNLVISSPSGTYSELIKFDDFGVYYELPASARELPDLPAGSTISIPGADFPAFASVKIPDVDRIANASVSNLEAGILSTDSQFSWSSAGQSGKSNTMLINMYMEDSSGADYTVVEVTCLTADDGEFSFPEDVKALIAQYSFDVGEVFFAAVGISTEVSGDAAVQVIHTSRFTF